MHTPIQFVINHREGYSMLVTCTEQWEPIETKIQLQCVAAGVAKTPWKCNFKIFLVKKLFPSEEYWKIAAGQILVGKQGNLQEFPESILEALYKFQQLQKHSYWVKQFGFSSELLIGYVCIKKK